MGHASVGVVGWEELVTLGAYAVNIKHAATRDRGAILQLLSQKQSAGAASRKIWEFPAVRAVINYHWQHWAERFLMAASLLFVGWFLSFSGYCIVYIVMLDAQYQRTFLMFPVQEADVDASGIGGAIPWIHLLSYVLNLLCFIFMFPFAVMEYWTIVEQGRRWIQPRNVTDVCAIVLQTLIFVCHLLNWSVGREWFAYVLALQCVFLLAKLQIFGRFDLDSVLAGAEDMLFQGVEFRRFLLRCLSLRSVRCSISAIVYLSYWIYCSPLLGCYIQAR